MNTQVSLNHIPVKARPSTTGRAGLSVLESVGCLIALVGGLWLGASYLGIDVRHAAYVALSDSELMDKIPEKWRPVEPASKNEPTSAELAAAMDIEFAALHQEVADLGTGQPSQSPPAVEVHNPQTEAGTETNDPAKRATLAYWRRIRDVVHKNSKLQSDAEAAASKDNATMVAVLKGRISRLSANAIRALPTANVDLAAVKLGKRLAAWYENGADLDEEAVQVWQSPSRSPSSTQAIKEWQQARLQHQNERRILEGRITAVRDSLTRQFGDGFAPLAGP